MKVYSWLINIVRAARPVHWVKNLSLFAALVFTGNLQDHRLFLVVFYAFLVFGLVTSSTYIFNDVLDAESDKKHPIKKYRPVASGKLPASIAMIVSLTLAVLSLYFAINLNVLFFLLVASYLLLQAIYSLGLKNFAVIDILLIATGFIIRVYAGAFVIDAHLSVWFLLCVVSVALFLASGKRRSEINIVQKAPGTRKSLSKYPKELLNSYVTMFGNAAWMSWALFTFFESPSTNPAVWLFLAELSRTTTISKLLMSTIPVVIFIIMRYEAIIFEGKSEAPEKVLLTDKALVVAIILWTLMVTSILYGGVAIPGVYP